MTQLSTCKPLGSYCERCEKSVKYGFLLTLDTENGTTKTTVLCRKCRKEIKRIVKKWLIKEKKTRSEVLK